MNAEEIRFLPYYRLSNDWEVHLIDGRTNERQLERMQRIIEDAQLFAFDAETMPSFFHPDFRNNQHRLDACPPAQSSCISKPSLLQVAVRNSSRTSKHVLFFDLQELFDRSNRQFQECATTSLVHQLIHLILNHTDALKLSQSFANDLAHLKCAYDEDCFHRSILFRVLELSDIYRKVFPAEKAQLVYGLQRMTAMTLHVRLNKKQQCANWSQRPLKQSMMDYAAMDVIVMIDIYDRLKTRLTQADPTLDWENFQRSAETSIDLNGITLYPCVCSERFVTNKTRNKHARMCPVEQQRLTDEAPKPKQEHVAHKKVKNGPTTVKLSSTRLELGEPIPCGRGYVPPALKRAYQSLNHISFCEQVRSSSSFNQLNRFAANRPPDAQFFLDDDDAEVAHAFGLQAARNNAKLKLGKQLTAHVASARKQHLKIAAYPPKASSTSSTIRSRVLDENELLDRLQDDFDSQPEFHCHLFGLGGRGRVLSIDFPPPAPSISRSVGGS